ncbi:MAG TPA: hypothetical protein VF828_00350 [Patescibacteria group bacterium]
MNTRFTRLFLVLALVAMIFAAIVPQPVKADYQSPTLWATTSVRYDSMGQPYPVVTIYVSNGLGLRIQEENNYPWVDQLAVDQIILFKAEVTNLVDANGIKHPLSFGQNYRFVLKLDGTVYSVFSINTYAPDPEINISMSAPGSIGIGGWPLDIVLTASNTSTGPKTFEGFVTLDLGATDGSTSMDMTNGQYNMWAADNVATYYWTGQLNPGQQSSITIHTYSGIWAGSYPDFIQASFNGQTLTQSLILTEGIGKPGGNVWLADSGGNPVDMAQIKAGGYFLNLDVWSPTLTQFQMLEPMTSTCGIDQLPTGFIGNPQKGWEEHRWWITIPNDAPAGICTVRAIITSWPDMTTFATGGRFIVIPDQPYKNFIPIAINN